MQHQIPVEQLGPAGPAMAAAVDACVHCGFCLSACPTYLVLGEEMDSPRGRIYLMKEALEGHLPLAGSVSEHVDRCLGCLACVSACPSGVQYGQLLTPFRALREEQAPRPWIQRRLRQALLATLTHPRRFRRAVALATAARPLLAAWLEGRARPGKQAEGEAPAAPGGEPGEPDGGRPASPGGVGLARRLAALLALTPPRVPPPDPLPPVIPARGPRRARVALLAGCVQQVLAPEINRATAQVLAANGVEVVVPAAQGCCGALAMHAGELERARRLAAVNLRAFPADVDAVVVNAAGCGSAMKEYGHLFAGHPEEEAARRLAARVRDVAEFLDELGPREPGPLPAARRVAYHDACHLAHGQGIRTAPRRLLAAIPNLELVELDEPDLCCGSAGTYNLEHPEVARALQERKVASIRRSGAAAVATGNIGCLVQLRQGLERAGLPVPVVHTVQLLAEAYQALPAAL
ncbi:4Fe-4S dicluster domain-containing protein [Thermaerobacter sp. PB12/4term]|uniref:(Fe-S)-binding protein n=1 Tax=Thermaerobacter sp. PB12/4term TaxID=2293838 RepID=UPI000E327A91|nr:heterodisulfide reductase-related iron-sulfur binding cluster [Thermaerobacter sp. PB12/4term]QIA27305.1 4Fe-4S dicluster domain-containing protein [Thermaerobacter sp. PB12/4term]